MTTDKEVMADNTIDSSVYDKVIRKIKQKHILPDSDTESAWENNLSIHYAMEDVNQDGVMELFIKLDQQLKLHCPTCDGNTEKLY